MTKKTYIGFVNDHSVSMQSISRAAARDYNATTASVKKSAIQHNQNVLVSLVDCAYGHTDRVRRVFEHHSVTALQPISENAYETNGGGTPLLDSVGELIEIFDAVPDRNDPEVSFVLFVTTDGKENASRKYRTGLPRLIADRQGTDRWSFVFRVPRGYTRELMKFGVPEGNIYEWDQTNAGVATATRDTETAFDSFFTARAAGATSTKSFYADLSKVTSKDVATTMRDISAEVSLWPVPAAEVGTQIRTFVEKRLAGKPLLKGAAFYQLVKTEKEVQDHKRLVIRDKTTNSIYEGAAARQMMGLPTYGTIRLRPDDLGQFDLFIQSTSVNRKVDQGTQVLYWPAVGVAYKEGISAR